MIFILDNGHGIDTPGKRSPIWEGGGQLLEWQFTRTIVKGISKRLDAMGVPNVILVPEDKDISLKERCSRANTIYKECKDSVLISVHANAGGGTGFECFTSKGNTKSDLYASVMYDKASQYLKGWKMRSDRSDGDVDKEENFYILRYTNCPAILTENLFMDTEKDCRFLMSKEGQRAIIDMHVAAIIEINNLYGKR